MKFVGRGERRRTLKTPELISRCVRVVVLLFLVVLHVRRECCRRVVSAIAHRALIGFAVVVRLHVDLQVVASGERGFALSALVLAVPGVQLDVAVAATLVLEKSLAEIAFKRHLVAVNLKKHDTESLVMMTQTNSIQH